jgi:hypothetical protein
LKTESVLFRKTLVVLNKFVDYLHVRIICKCLFIFYLFRYHEDGSKKLNACNQFFLCMVYLKPKYKISLFTEHTYITAFTHGIQLMLTPPLAPYYPLFLLATPYLCYPLFLLTWRTSYLAHGANTHPLLSLVCYQLLTLCYFSHPNTPHRSSYNIYIDDINNISRPIWYNTSAK